MNAIIRRVVLLMVAVFVSVSWAAQGVPPSHPVPRLVQFHGTLNDLSGIVGVTFALYTEPSGGVPLWLEMQNVNVGPDGGYTVLLGTAHRDGVPLEIFSGNEARWLGVQAEGRAEEPRVLLVSVPYALKAADAETLGGRPPSSYVLAIPDANTETRLPAATGTSSAASQTTFADTTSDQVVLVQQNGSGSALNAQSTSGAAIMATNSATSGTGYAIFASNNSPEGHALEAVANSATGLNYGVQGTARSNAGIGVLGEATSATGNTFGVVGMASSPNGVGVKSYSQNIGIWAEAAGSTGNTLGLVATAYSPAGTAAMFANHAGGKLFSGQVMGVEKFKVDGNGNVFANAYFDLAGNGIGGGGGTITGVTAGGGLTGGGTSGNVTLNLDSTVVRNFGGSTSLGSLTLSGGLAGTTAGFSGSNTASILSASQAGDGIPVPAVNAIPPAAVSGTATATSRYVAGLLGSSTASPNGAGVLGVNFASAGLYDSAPGVWGVNFNATNGVGVFGEADEATNTDAAANGFPIGVYGASMSPIGVGVGGVDQAPVGRTLGVWGGVNSVNGYAVEGNAYDTCLTVPTDGCGPTGMPNHFGIGVAGYSEGDHGKGVVGYALHATGSTIGVRGHVVSPAGVGGLFENYAGGDNRRLL